MLLTSEELVELTGYQRPSDQISALKGWGAKPLVGRDGRPRITWEAVHRVMAALETTPTMANEQPNWDALKRRA